jgi:cytoskeletal protein RodZ
MSQLGHYLREQREKKQMTLDHIQDLTKIRKVYLQAIESGEFSKLPGAFYVRAFSKSYAEALGLNFQSIVETFESELNSLEPDSDAEPKAVQRRSKPANLERFVQIGSSFLLIGLVAVLLLVIYFVVVHFTKGSDHVLDQTRITKEAKIYVSPSPSPKETPVQSVIPSETPDESVGNTDVTLVGTEANSLIFNVANVKKLKISMDFNENCWTLFRKDNMNGEIIKGPLNKSMYVKGDNETLEASQALHLRFGNAMAVTLKINGVKIDEPLLKEQGAKNVQINLVKAVSTASPSTEQ